MASDNTLRYIWQYICLRLFITDYNVFGNFSQVKSSHFNSNPCDFATSSSIGHANLSCWAPESSLVLKLTSVWALFHSFLHYWQWTFFTKISLMWPHLQRESALYKYNARKSISFAILHCYPFKLMLDYDLRDTDIEMIEITKYSTTVTHPQSFRFDLKHRTLSGAIIMYFGCRSECILLKWTQNIVCIPDVSLSTSCLKHLMCVSNLQYWQME